MHEAMQQNDIEITADEEAVQASPVPEHRKIAQAVKRPKTLVKAIEKARLSLAEKSQKYGVYENFGQEEVNFIENKFIELGNFCNEQLRRRTAVKEFAAWCKNYKSE